MNAVVVYDSLWGNTARIAEAVAEGLGTGSRALSTAEATAEALAGASLIVAGSPLLGFSLPTEDMRRGIAEKPSTSDAKTAQPSMRAWIESLPHGTGQCAGFETRIWWSPGSAAKAIASRLAAKGYTQIAPAEKFVVTGQKGPLKDGEVARAIAWGARLADLAAMRN